MNNIFYKLVMFIVKQKGPFTIADFLVFASLEQNAENVNAIYDMLIGNDIAYIYASNTNNLINQQWICKNDFFTGKEFAISPTDFEIEKGILIIGSRFVWTVSKYGHIDEIEFLVHGKKIDHNFVSVHNKFIPTYYFLESEYTLTNELINENQKNIEIMTNLYQDTYLWVMALDLSKFYKEIDFQSGDIISCKIISFEEKKIEILPKKSPKLNHDEKIFWVYNFNLSISQASKILGIKPESNTIIDFAFFLAQDFLFEEKKLSLEEALFENKEVQCMDYGFEVRLWPTDSKLPMPTEWSTIMYPCTCELDTFFRDLSIPISKNSLSICILDFFANNYLESLDESVMYNFATNFATKVLPIDVDKITYNKNLKQLIKVILSESKNIQYNRFSDTDEFIYIRSKIVILFTEMIVFVNILISKNKSPADFDSQYGLSLNQLLVKTAYLIDYFSNFTVENKNDIEPIAGSIDNMIEIYKTLKIEIQNQLKNN